LTLPTHRHTLFRYTTLFRSRQTENPPLTPYMYLREPKKMAIRRIPTSGKALTTPWSKNRNRNLCAPERSLEKHNPGWNRRHYPRSEEHTSELQSRENLVCRL